MNADRGGRGEILRTSFKYRPLVVFILLEPLGEEGAELVEGPEGELLLHHGSHLLLQTLQLAELHEVSLGVEKLCSRYTGWLIWSWKSFC